METVEFVTEEDRHFNCIDGWIQTLRAYRMMTEELLEEIPFILMSRFNQDALENFFSQVSSELIAVLTQIKYLNVNWSPPDFIYNRIKSYQNNNVQ